jgi:hypothetical protein
LVKNTINGGDNYVFNYVFNYIINYVIPAFHYALPMPLYFIPPHVRPYTLYLYR